MLDSQQFLSKLASTHGIISVDSGVAWFEDGTSVDLTILASNRSATPVALTIESEGSDRIIVLAQEGVSIVEADEKARSVLERLASQGLSDDYGRALEAFERAGFVLPMCASVSPVG